VGKNYVSVGDAPGSALTPGLLAPGLPPYSALPTASSHSHFKEELIALLHIPTHLTGTGEVSLQIAYQKYKAFLTAIQTYNEMTTAGTWTVKRPTRTDIIALFVSKSFFHSHYKRYFSKVVEYEEMVAWLDQREDRLSDVDVWGVEKAVYTFTDLAVWLENGGSLEVEGNSDYEDGNGKVGKGKGKEKEKEKEKFKGKNKGKGKSKGKKKKAENM
jgi:hypothetical protein